jgi:hypothetical protein
MHRDPLALGGQPRIVAVIRASSCSRISRCGTEPVPVDVDAIVEPDPAEALIRHTA